MSTPGQHGTLLRLGAALVAFGLGLAAIVVFVLLIQATVK
jgi:hypothetical protein